MTRRLLSLPLFRLAIWCHIVWYLAILGNYGNAQAATSTVTSLADDGSSGTLRSQIAAANDGDTVTFATGLSGTITLDGTEITINKNLTLQGPGTDVITVSGNNASRIFDISYPSSSSVVTISGLTLSGGSATFDGTYLGGGAIRMNAGSTTNLTGTTNLTDCVLSNNTAPGSVNDTNDGGAIASNYSTINLTNCVLSNNTAPGGRSGGGAIVTNGTMTLNNCTLSNNSSGAGAGAIANGGTLMLIACTLSNNSSEDGAITSSGSAVSVSNSTFSNNSSYQGGAAIDGGIMTVTNCTFTGNSAHGSGSGGGALFSTNSSTVTNSIFNNNSVSAGNGGAIFAQSPLNIANCTFSGNSASTDSTNQPGNGGALFNDNGATLNVANCTFNNNSAQRSGGGLSNFGTVTIANSTFSGNSAVSRGGGIASYADGIYTYNGTLNLGNSIVAGNSASIDGSDLFGMLASGDYNLVQSTAGATLSGTHNIIGVQPKLGPLQNNGGPTPTMALASDSPAIDAGQNAAVDSNNQPVLVDQRGLPRPVDVPGVANASGGDGSDIGAYEYQVPGLDLNGPAAGLNNSVTFTEKAGPVNLVTSDAALTDSNSSTLIGATVTLDSTPNSTSESLAANTTGTSITANYNATTRTLTLSGTDTLANYLQVLKTVTYNNTSLDPAATLRLAAFSINDGVQVSAPVTTTITVVPVNDAPTFIGGGNVTVAEDSGAYSQTWATNISSVEAGQTVTISVSNNNTSLFAAQPTINSSGVLTFTPAPDANGQATVTVTFKDNGGTANGGKDTTTATFTITVTPVNDAPVAAGQNLTTAEDTPLSIILKATDIDSPTLTYTVVTAPAHGTLSGSGANRTYTPAANYNGPDSFTFKANDGALDSNVATINITITPVNDAPVAQDDTYTLNGLQLTVPAPGVLGNDSDVEGDTLHTLLVAQPVHGTLTLNANGSFSYTPAIGFNGVDSFTYKANDGSLDSNAATVTLTIGGNPGQSVALSLSSHSVSEGTSVMGTLTFSRPSAGDVTVTLLSSDNTVATVSTPVTIPAGQTTATFTVTTPRNPLATGPQQVTISANAGDYGTALDNLTVMDNESPTLTLTVAPTAINENYGPAAALATLTRNTPTTQAVRVTLLNSNAKAIKVPPSVVIPAGSASVTFWVAALDNRIGNKAQTAELIARTTGYQDGIAQLSIADNGKVTQDLKLTLAGGTTYTEQVGGQTVRGTLTLSGTPLAKNLTITLVSSEAQRIAVPASVLLRAGQSTVNFTFHVLDNTVADGPHQVWLTARALGFGTAAVLVTVLDNDGPALSLSLPRTSVAENAGSLTATVTRLHVPITDSLTVNLSSSDKTRVAVPTTVTIPAGKAATTFKVTILNNKVVDGNHVVTLTASETGLLAGTSKLTVVDDDKPTPAPRSAVGLSTATVSVANGIQLHFTGALDADSAQDATHYAVMVNGVVVEVQSLAYAAATHTVKLTLTDGAVQVGDSVVVTWQDVQDTQGRSLAGSTGVVTAR